MTTFKQIAITILAFAAGIVVGNMIVMDFDWASLTSLYDIAGYVDIFWDFFKE